MRFAIVDSITLKVVNTCEWEGAEWLPPVGTYIVQSNTAGEGDVYSPLLGTFSRPNDGGLLDDIGGLLGGGL